MYFYLVNMFVLNRSNSNVDLILLDVFCCFFGKTNFEGKICCPQFTLFYRVECEKLFCKTYLKLKVLKLIKTKI